MRIAVIALLCAGCCPHMAVPDPAPDQLATPADRHAARVRALAPLDLSPLIEDEILALLFDAVECGLGRPSVARVCPPLDPLRALQLCGDGDPLQGNCAKNLRDGRLAPVKHSSQDP